MKWLKVVERVKQIASPSPFCPVNCECLWKKIQTEEIASVMIVSNIFRPLYVTWSFAPNVHGYHYCYHYCYHNNAFGFNMRIFRIRSGFKKKTRNFSNSIKWNTFGKFQFNMLSVKKSILLHQYHLGRYPNLGVR